MWPLIFIKVPIPAQHHFVLNFHESHPAPSDPTIQPQVGRLSDLTGIKIFSILSDLVAGERIQDGVSSWLPCQGLRSDERVLALGGDQQANLQTDAPRHGEHVPGNGFIIELINTNESNICQVMQQQSMSLVVPGSGGGRQQHPAFQTAVVRFVLLTPSAGEPRELPLRNWPEQHQSYCIESGFRLCSPA